MLKTWTGGLPAGKAQNKAGTERAEVDLFRGLRIGHPFMENFEFKRG